MRLSKEDILAKVDTLDHERGEYQRMAREWENMWALKLYSKTEKEAIEEEGREQVTLPVPYNVVNLSMRLLSEQVRVEVPSEGATDKSDKIAERKESFLNAFWQNTNREQGRNVLSDLKWQAFVRGRFAFEVKWVEADLPKILQGRRCPIIVRALDPLNVGVKQGPLFTEFAYHRWSESINAAKQLYPNLESVLKRKKKTGGEAKEAQKDQVEVEVTDFWWTNPKTGRVWNAVLVEGEFIYSPRETDYPLIPIFEGGGDTAPATAEENRALSILFPIMKTWPYQSRLASQMATGILWYFWPFVYMTNEFGVELPDIQVEPGRTERLPMGTRVEVVRIDPNVPLAQAVMNSMEQMNQESTFPGVLYGKAPGDLQAGYGVSLLSDAAKGRIKQFRDNLEMSLSHANSLIMGLIEEFGDEDEGVKVYGRDVRTESPFAAVLKPKDIGGFYENIVSISVSLPQDDMQRKTMALRMNEAGIMSRQTILDTIFKDEVPPDELRRVDIERAMTDEVLKQKTAILAMMGYYPDSWTNWVAGTPYEELAVRSGWAHKMPDGSLMAGKDFKNLSRKGIMPPSVPPAAAYGPQQIPATNGNTGQTSQEQGMQQPQPPQQPQGSMQPPTLNYDTGAIPPELQGQIGQEAMGDMNMSPEQLQMMLGANPSLRDELMRMVGLGGQ